MMRSLVCLLLGLFCVSGCVSKNRADLQKREAFVAGQQQQQMMAQKQKQIPPNSVWVDGNVKTEMVPWVEDMTVAKAIVAAEYQDLVSPTHIILVRNGQVTDVNPADLLRGDDIPVQPGDAIHLFH